MKNHRNQPKYMFFKNWNYAIQGTFEVLKNETAFKIEMLLFVFLSTGLYFLNIPLSNKIIIFSTFIIVLIIELLNSALERCVDLVTKEYHILAKHAKDAASAAVMFANFLALVICSYFIYINFIIESV